MGAILRARRARVYAVAAGVPARRFRLYSGEFGAKIENHRGIVDPNNDRNEGTGSAIGGADRGLAEIQPEQRLAHREQQRRRDGSFQHVSSA